MCDKEMYQTNFDTPTAPMLQEPPAYPNYPVQANTTVIIQQPGLNVGSRIWSSGICSCFDDIPTCCCAIFCSTCAISRLYSRYDECCCTSCFVPHALFSLRVQHRNRHRISGSMLNDLCTATCCFMCSICQLKRDMDYVVATKGSLAM